MLGLSLPPLNDSSVINEQFPAKVGDETILAHKNSWAKRLFDIILSAMVIAGIMVWLIPLMGLVIRLTSPGPILFIQLRMGRNGRPFKCLKFRTMTYEKNAQFKQATKNDVRITQVGRFLRKSNLDELPQVLNVLWGDMSIVGPRPHPIQLDAQHWYTLPGYPNRYAVKPGITGLAQARGHRGETETLQKMQHRVRLDRFYIANKSLGLDIKICGWTLTSMIKGDKRAW